uniref:Putative secreted protein n=1 Tax=Ixodes ricinus TaxID=34613 RepID=A0A6B0TYG1_IXORI
MHLEYIPNTSVAVLLALLLLRYQGTVCFTCGLLQLVFGLWHDFAWHFPPARQRSCFASSFNCVCRLCSVSDTSCKMKCMAATHQE